MRVFDGRFMRRPNVDWHVLFRAADLGDSTIFANKACYFSLRAACLRPLGCGASIQLHSVHKAVVDPQALLMALTIIRKFFKNTPATICRVASAHKMCL
jgi:hypothetical protein